MRDKMSKLEGTRSIGKRKNVALEIMLFKKRAKCGFLQSPAGSHRKDLTERMRNTAHGECFAEAYWESGHSVT